MFALLVEREDLRTRRLLPDPDAVLEFWVLVPDLGRVTPDGGEGRELAELDLSPERERAGVSDGRCVDLREEPGLGEVGGGDRPADGEDRVDSFLFHPFDVDAHELGTRLRVVLRRVDDRLVGDRVAGGLQGRLDDVDGHVTVGSGRTVDRDRASLQLPRAVEQLGHRDSVAFDRGVGGHPRCDRTLQQLV